MNDDDDDYTCMVYAPDNVTVEVVNVVMKNIENYLPSDVIKENEAM